MTEEPQEPKTYRTKEQQEAATHAAYEAAANEVYPEPTTSCLEVFKNTPAIKPKTRKTKRLNKKLPRVAILLDATVIISQDRNATHGEPEDSFANIAKLWSAYLSIPVTSEDVCHLMTLLKIGRTQSNPAYVEDNYVDAVGYEALAGELREAAESKDSK